MDLIPDQPVYAVALRESFYEVILVLPDSLDEVRRHSDVEGPVGFAGEDVDAGDSHGCGLWIPAFAGMTGVSAGATVARAGMTGVNAGMTELSARKVVVLAVVDNEVPLVS